MSWIPGKLLTLHQIYSMNLAGFWRLVEIAFNWAVYWRFNVCFYGGAVLALLAIGSIPYQPLDWIVAGVIFGSALVIGNRWHYSSR